MRKITVVSYITMDGVLQAPGGSEEDRTNGFKWGGWSFHYWDEMMTHALEKIMSTPYDLLLGRRTYEIFAAYWPYKNDAIGEAFNRVKKYVVATTPIDLSWKETILVSKDVVNQLKELKNQDGPDLLVFGSSGLIQTLISSHLVDVLHTWIFPITFGEGKTLFKEGPLTQQWKLTASVVSTTGVVIGTYIPDGEVKFGSFLQEEPGEAEMARREKWSRE